MTPEERIRQQQIIDMLIDLREKIDALWAVATKDTHWSDNFRAAQNRVEELLFPKDSQ